MSPDQVPELPKLDEEDVKAVRSSLPGKLVSRTAAFLSLCVLFLGYVILANKGLQQLLDEGHRSWALATMVGFGGLAIVAQLVIEWHTGRNRRKLKRFALIPFRLEPGYFRVGPYQDTAKDREDFRRADRAEEEVLEWLKTATSIPLYLIGDSGCGKSSLMNAFVLPKVREQGWTVVQARAGHDPQAALHAALSRLVSDSKATANLKLREILAEASKHTPGQLLVVLDQFEEFVILTKPEPERQRDLAAFISELQTCPLKDVVLLFVMRGEYEKFLPDIGLPLARTGENRLQITSFRLAAAEEFIKRSPLRLEKESLDGLLASAAELDGTSGLVRPITLNVIGYFLDGKSAAPSLDAGILVRLYIAQTVEQPAIRDLAPRLLEKMITEQGTKWARSEHDLGADAKLRRGEVRAVLNRLSVAGLARAVDPGAEVWELSHDFIARAVARFLGRVHRQGVQRIAAYAVPALLAISLLGGVWLTQPYLQERMNWFFRVRPYVAKHVRPFVLTPEGELALQPGKSFRECDDDKKCPEMVIVPADEDGFTMGSPSDEKGREPNEGPQHSVKIDRPFAVSKFEVTFDQWDVCVAYGGCIPAQDVWGRGSLPVISVSWNDATSYAAWLSKLTGRPYRLLSEAEWEYAARARPDKKYQKYPWGDDIRPGGQVMANCAACGSYPWGGKQTAPVGSFPANAFGLHDMQGNLWNWVQDCYHDSYAGAPLDGSAWTSGNCSRRVLRGGNWFSEPSLLRSAQRNRGAPGLKDDLRGFRIARTLLTSQN